MTWGYARIYSRGELKGMPTGFVEVWYRRSERMVTVVYLGNMKVSRIAPVAFNALLDRDLSDIIGHEDRLRRVFDRLVVSSKVENNGTLQMLLMFIRETLRELRDVRREKATS